MKVLKTSKIVCFDVDDTLVMWKGSDYKPHQLHIDSLIRHAKREHYVIVWSAGGVDWAKKIVEELQLTQYVDLVCCKPAWYVDDKKADEWMERYYYPYEGEIK